MVRTRIAPSPTGIPHIGTTRTALFNYLFAKSNNGEFILRIEDTDRARFVEEAEDKVLEMLSWLGLNWDGKIVKQSDRLPIYKEHAEILKAKNLAYDDNGALRFRMPKDGLTGWVDSIANKEISFENKKQEDFVIIKSDGYPTYNFANVIDDHFMQITHVMRGEEFISSTPKHIQLYIAFGWELPIFAHLPVVLGPDKQKLSKRHGAKSALEYKDEGYLKQALLNYMALLGWNPGGDREIVPTLEEMADLFDLKDVNTASPVFDTHKLTWMNQQYIQNTSDVELKELILKFSPKAKELSSDTLDKLIPLLKSRMETLMDFEKSTGIFFDEFGDAKFEEIEKSIAQSLAAEFEKTEKWTHDNIFAAIKKIMTEHKVRMPIIYKLMTGTEKGLPLPESLEILGKKRSIERLKEVRSK